MNHKQQAARIYRKAQMKAKMDSDFALMNGGGVRANLNAGKVTLKKG
ncbi:5'-nucleotidase C-terminal domain-containing protein [Ectobacillus funiculus]|nr:5'-nucleotidase C-terminal domain-containing protein [Ectobacillus funiculus]